MGRTGSNASVFIALYMGKLCVQKNLTWPTGNLCSESWQTSLKEAMIKGNLIHDDLFDQEGINVTVDDAVSMAGEECRVRAMGPQVAIFGLNPVDQLANFFNPGGSELDTILFCHCCSRGCFSCYCSQ